MRLLVACERSGRVRDEFRKRGHDAWSCDLEKDDNRSPFHIVGDALKVIFNCGPWGGMVGHPPCTFLCNSSVHLLTCGRPQEANRWKEMEAGAYFFLQLWAAPIPKVCLENPVMHGHAQSIIQIEYAQMIQPFQFGEPESKSTCLWLRGLPPPVHHYQPGRRSVLANTFKAGVWALGEPDTKRQRQTWRKGSRKTSFQHLPRHCRSNG